MLNNMSNYLYVFRESLVPNASLRSHSCVSISDSILNFKQHCSDMRACLTKPGEKKNMNSSMVMYTVNLPGHTGTMT